MNIYLATTNSHKVDELRSLFQKAEVAVSIESASSIGGMPYVDENADSFAGNALLKAQALLPRIPKEAYVLADDSGLVVDALEGAPGVLSARFAGLEASASENNEKLLRDLNGVPDIHRTARFVCHLVLMNSYGKHEFKGKCEGRIAQEVAGSGGFGYDPLFVPHGYGETFADLGSSIKNEISHRARALSALVDWLKV